MANTTFSGPVRSLNGFISFGPKAVVSLTANTTLTVASHAGRVLTCNDADGVFTLPTILASSASAVAGANDYNVLSNLGATFTFLVEQRQQTWISKQTEPISLRCCVYRY